MTSEEKEKIRDALYQAALIASRELGEDIFNLSCYLNTREAWRCAKEVTMDRTPRFGFRKK